MYYDEVARALAVYPLSQHFDRSWTAHVAVKAALYDAESQMQAAQQQRAEDNVNVEITRLKVGARPSFKLPMLPPLQAGVHFSTLLWGYLNMPQWACHRTETSLRKLIMLCA